MSALKDSSSRNINHQQWTHEKHPILKILQPQDSYRILQRILQQCDLIHCHTISLTDKLTLMRMKLPCRSLHCKHLQCFDYESYLLHNRKVPAYLYQCPVCGASANPTKVYLDTIWEKLLEAFPQETILYLHADGRCSSSQTEEDQEGTKKKKKKQKKQQYVEVFDVDANEMVMISLDPSSLESSDVSEVLLSDLVRPYPAISEELKTRRKLTDLAHLARCSLCDVLYVLNGEDHLPTLQSLGDKFKVDLIQARPFVCQSFEALVHDVAAKLQSPASVGFRRAQTLVDSVVTICKEQFRVLLPLSMCEEEVPEQEQEQKVAVEKGRKEKERKKKDKEKEKEKDKEKSSKKMNEVSEKLGMENGKLSDVKKKIAEEEDEDEVVIVEKEVVKKAKEKSVPIIPVMPVMEVLSVEPSSASKAPLPPQLSIPCSPPPRPPPLPPPIAMLKPPPPPFPMAANLTRLPQMTAMVYPPINYLPLQPPPPMQYGMPYNPPVPHFSAGPRPPPLFVPKLHSKQQAPPPPPPPPPCPPRINDEVLRASRPCLALMPPKACAQCTRKTLPSLDNHYSHSLPVLRSSQKKRKHRSSSSFSAKAWSTSGGSNRANQKKFRHNNIRTEDILLVHPEMAQLIPTTEMAQLIPTSPTSDEQTKSERKSKRKREAEQSNSLQASTDQSTQSSNRKKHKDNKERRDSSKHRQVSSPKSSASNSTKGTQQSRNCSPQPKAGANDNSPRPTQQVTSANKHIIFDLVEDDTNPVVISPDVSKRKEGKAKDKNLSKAPNQRQQNRISKATPPASDSFVQLLVEEFING
eukprot:scaffold601_cov170-Ochromonas_danica.AAC.50